MNTTNGQSDAVRRVSAFVSEYRRRIAAGTRMDPEAVYSLSTSGDLLELRVSDLAALASSPPAPGGDAVPVVQQTAPKRIWLAVSDDAHDEQQPFPDSINGEVTWSDDTPVEVCVPYVRADLAAAPAPAVEREAVDSREHGLFRKYRIERTDGSDQPGGKHDGCDYFVLDMSHDPHARPAIVAYARSLMAAGTHPLLVQDLVDRYVGLDIVDTPPAEAREPVGDADEDRAIALNKASPRADRIAALQRLSQTEAQPRDTPRDSGDAWQPIETAPKDAPVWAFNGEQGVMQWSEGEGWALWLWAETLLCDVDPAPIQPTHWQPLPAPPVQSPTGEPT